MEQEKIYKVLTTVFLLLAIATVAVYFLSADRTYFYYCGGAALFVRLVQYFMKFLM